MRRRAARLVVRVVLGFLVATAVPVLVLRWAPPRASSIMLQREIESRLAGEGGVVLQHRWVPLRHISPELAVAVVTAEDQKFPMHSGFDWDSIGDVIEEGDARPRGASTLTQQVAKNLFLWPGRSFVRKGLEAWFTILLEALWPKRRILEVYLNVAEFGPGVYGAGAASERYFHKSASALSRHEAALLAAVLPSPRRLRVAAPSSYLLERAAWIQRHSLGRSYLSGL